MQPSRLYPFASIIAATTAIALTSLPWMNLRPLDIDLSWNGLGMGGVDGVDVAPAGRGWLIVAACVITILAALIALMPAEQARPIARLANAAGAVVALLAAFVPIAVMIWPGWYFGDVLVQIGATDLRDVLAPSKAILIPLTLVLLVTAALCAAMASESTDRPRPAGSSPTT